MRDNRGRTGQKCVSCEENKHNSEFSRRESGSLKQTCDQCISEGVKQKSDSSIMGFAGVNQSWLCRKWT